MGLHWPSVPGMVFLGIAGVCLPLLDRWWVPRVKARPALRIRAYRWLVLCLWVLAVAIWAERRGAGLLLAHGAGEPAWMLGCPWREVTVLTVVALLTGVLLSSGIRCLLQPRLVPAYTRAHAAIGWFLPHTLAERRWWVLVSVTAGITEEWMFRGYLLHVLRGEAGFSLTVAMVISSCMFGLGHLYQGWRGAATAGVLGFCFATMTVLSGGLVVPIVVHAWMDLQLLVIFRPERTGHSAGQPIAEHP